MTGLHARGVESQGTTLSAFHLAEQAPLLVHKATGSSMGTWTGAATAVMRVSCHILPWNVNFTTA